MVLGTTGRDGGQCTHGAGHRAPDLLEWGQRSLGSGPHSPGTHSHYECEASTLATRWRCCTTNTDWMTKTSGSRRLSFLTSSPQTPRGSTPAQHPTADLPGRSGSDHGCLVPVRCRRIADVHGVVALSARGGRFTQRVNTRESDTAEGSARPSLAQALDRHSVLESRGSVTSDRQNVGEPPRVSRRADHLLIAVSSQRGYRQAGCASPRPVPAQLRKAPARECTYCQTASTDRARVCSHQGTWPSKA